MSLIKWLGGYGLIGVGILFILSAFFGGQIWLLLIGVILILIGSYYKKIAVK
jgi:hypothetical protein